ncbi:hypothetical protein [Chitinophaga nivalis]|uniref:FecR protein domain-containing protein n=1 Tax=Chitinophaga nivalis TaxID=2991709 RepID=A0ABT3IHG9_9BACT|nr:hypothetical protein [Chitinophaga nivalis]MCW3467059.1 hypothetical protein [Chitinophaga nivalis]MCW3483250.1 hypothetical protein [Chitinophaga nivalis]
MKISPALLQQYHVGTCSPAERAAVEQWLLDTEEEMPLQEWTDVATVAVKEQMWQVIDNTRTVARNRQRKARIRRLVYYPVAACLLMVLGMVFKNSPWLTRSLIIDNRAYTTARTITVGNLEFKIEANSVCKIDIQLTGDAGNIAFCGAVSVVNKAAGSRDIQFNTGLSGCGEMPCNDQVHLHQGQTYMAMTDDDYHLISATKDEIADGLPRSFSTRLIQRFNLAI